MKINVNRNILWSKALIEQLARLGVKDACISPGSRNTPLIYALASNKKIKSRVIIDERASSFFALGIAKQSGSPVLIVTTSGTAAAELYPAIVEAYKSRTPLIICTADRPAYLRNKGANQTINQKDIFKNHIRFSADLPLPSITEKAFSKLKEKALKSFLTATRWNKGPVHLNIPFEKPFEPDSFTDTVENNLIKEIWSFHKTPPVRENIVSKKDLNGIKRISEMAAGCRKGIILCGNGDYDNSTAKAIALLSQKTGFPIAADGSTDLRFRKEIIPRLLDNYTSLCGIEKFSGLLSPEIIIQFGAAPTSVSTLGFLSRLKGKKYLINKTGDWCDPSLTAAGIIKCSPLFFCKTFANYFKGNNRSYEWFNEMREINYLAGAIKNSFINNQPFPFEGRIANELISSLPAGCNLVISNSLPVRDFDSFADAVPKDITVYTNRGASGIDGVISTSLGIASNSPRPTYLVIGDLAFYHDLNSLSITVKRSIPITIILINNNGGGIFEHLPISRCRDIFTEYFKTPTDLNFRKITAGYGCSYNLIKGWPALKKKINSSVHNKSATILEIRTDSADSLGKRRAFRYALENIIE